MRGVSLLVCVLPAFAFAKPFTLVSNDVRIQVISPSLVRLEQKGPLGFEDRNTFTVVNRDFGKVQPKVSHRGGVVVIETDRLTVVVPEHAVSLRDVEVFDSFNQHLYQYDGKLPENHYLPAPGFVKAPWLLSDNPRLIPPQWGATPAPKNVNPALEATSGWDSRNNAPDIYVFVPGPNGYEQLRQDFLKLTGPIPKPPLYILGFIDSRYYPYSSKEALDTIETYRKKQIPLDTFVVDTDWRVNGSAGYAVETKLFPNMGQFISDAHNKHVRLMFNDHPDPKAPGATDPSELAFRWAGLTSLMALGMDVWWYDRNWSTNLVEPMPGIRKEMWGQRLYHDITERFRPNVRPWIMTNAQGIDNGIEHYAPEAAGHRYPMMWTGDTGSTFDYLRRGVENGVNRGLVALQPYTHEDLGGHTGPTPSDELYIRYLEYGCLSPITRVHCTLGQDRHPWAFGSEAEEIVKRYINLRYRLLPTIYTAAQHTYETGTPLLRRCDLYWPTYAEAARSDQYLLGEDILVAPIVTSVYGEANPIPESLFQLSTRAPGLTAEYFANSNLEGEPKVVKVDPKIDFNWGTKAPLPDIPATHFSVRWTSILGPIPKSGVYQLVTKSDDGIRVYIDGNLVINDWKAENSAFNKFKVFFEAGSIHKLRVEYMQLTGGSMCTLAWLPPSTTDTTVSTKQVWIPPGQWQDLWTGEILEGPRTVTAHASVGQIPMWVSLGGVVLTGPEMQYTDQKPMDPITADLYMGPGGQTVRELVEDDGISNEYQSGRVARTSVQFVYSNVYGAVKLGSTVGTFTGMRTNRNWILRFHLPKGMTADNAKIDNKAGSFTREAKVKPLIPFAAGSSLGEGEVVTVIIPTSSIRKEHTVILEMKAKP